MVFEYPMPPFSWQQNQWAHVLDNIHQGRLLHAYLLTSVEGVGTDMFALSFAYYLLCDAPVNGRSCGKCKSCNLLKAQSHPDLHRVHLLEKSSQIKVDQIRQVNEFTVMTPQQGGRKVVLLAQADAMNVNASNALLKSLEEPSGDTVFILVSTTSKGVLPTIRSRCAVM